MLLKEFINMEDVVLIDDTLCNSNILIKHVDNGKVIVFETSYDVLYLNKESVEILAKVFTKLSGMMQP